MRRQRRTVHRAAAADNAADCAVPETTARFAKDLVDAEHTPESAGICRPAPIGNRPSKQPVIAIDSRGRLSSILQAPEVSDSFMLPKQPKEEHEIE